MQGDLICLRIIEGLYVGNRLASEDLDFLLSNKFYFLVNCTPEIPNFHEGKGLCYLRFKLNPQNPKPVFTPDFKLVNSLGNFVKASEDAGLCCLVHGNMQIQSAVMVVAAYLMDRFGWTLAKTMEFLISKDLNVNIPQPMMVELRQHQNLLSRTVNLTKHWVEPFLSEEEEIIAKTYLNSVRNDSTCQQRKKNARAPRITWGQFPSKKKDEAKSRQPRQNMLQVNEQQPQRTVSPLPRRDFNQRVNYVNPMTGVPSYTAVRVVENKARNDSLKKIKIKKDSVEGRPTEERKQINMFLSDPGHLNQGTEKKIMSMTTFEDSNQFGSETNIHRRKKFDVTPPKERRMGPKEMERLRQVRSNQGDRSRQETKKEYLTVKEDSRGGNLYRDSNGRHQNSMSQNTLTTQTVTGKQYIPTATNRPPVPQTDGRQSQMRAVRSLDPFEKKDKLSEKKIYLVN